MARGRTSTFHPAPVWSVGVVDFERCWLEASRAFDGGAGLGITCAHRRAEWQACRKARGAACTAGRRVGGRAGGRAAARAHARTRVCRVRVGGERGSETDARAHEPAVLGFRALRCARRGAPGLLAPWRRLVLCVLCGQRGVAGRVAHHPGRLVDPLVDALPAHARQLGLRSMKSGEGDGERKKHAIPLRVEEDFS